jgi:hypothetical protein
MARVRIAVKLAKRADDPDPERIQVEIADQLQEIRLFVHHDGPIAILEEMAGAPVAPIESARVPGQEAAHAAGQRARARADQQVEVIRQERPRINGPVPR